MKFATTTLYAHCEHEHVVGALAECCSSNSSSLSAIAGASSFSKLCRRDQDDLLPLSMSMPDEDEDGAGGPHSGGTATAVGAEDLSLAIATAAAGAEDSRRAFLDGGSASIWRAFKETLKSPAAATEPR